MSGAKSKQVGDLVEITGGLYKKEEGILHEKTSKGWSVKLKNGEVVLTSFPFVVALAKKGEFEEGDPWKSILEEEITEDHEAPIPEAEPEITETTAQEAPESPCTATEETGDEMVAPGEIAAQAPTGTAVPEETEESAEISDNLTKLTTLQLRDLAKQKGVAIARTKADFLRIIKEKNHGEDLERLKGKVLFDRVSELHISRLRSKQDLQKLIVQREVISKPKNKELPINKNPPFALNFLNYLNKANGGLILCKKLDKIKKSPII